MPLPPPPSHSPPRYTISQVRVLQGSVIESSGSDEVVKPKVALTEADCRAAALLQGLSIGGGGWAFSGDFVTKGCYTYSDGEFKGFAFYGTGGAGEQLSSKPSCAVLDIDIVRTTQVCLKVRVGGSVEKNVGLANNTGTASLTGLMVESLGLVYTDRVVLRVCENDVPPTIGPACGERAAPAVAVKAFGLSNASLKVTWAAAPGSTGGTLASGYHISLSSEDADEVNVEEYKSAGSTNAIFGLDRVKANMQYAVRVTSLYDNGLIQALPVGPSEHGGSLSCIPNTTARYTCECKDGELHTMNLVEGVPPEAWGCSQCLPGLECHGGTAETTVTTEGWFVGSTLGLTTVKVEANQVKHDSTKCVEFGFPVKNEWQSDPGCCSIHANADCADNYTTSKGDVCSSGSWGVAHHTKCEVQVRETTAKSFPSLHKCAKEGACPGNFQVSKLIDAGADVNVLFAQCKMGFTGIVCGACMPGYSYTSCAKCAITRDEARALAVGVLLIIFISAGIGYVLLKRASRPSLVERRFVVAFEKAESEFGIGGSLRAFGDVFGCTAEGGAEHEDFVRALSPGGKLESVTANRAGKEGHGGGEIGSAAAAAVQTLWDKLDKDGDGHIVASEFIDFFYDLKQGTGSTNPLRARTAWLYDWFCSTKTQTIKVVLITYVYHGSRSEESEDRARTPYLYGIRAMCRVPAVCGVRYAAGCVLG